MIALRFFGYRLTFANLLAAAGVMCPAFSAVAQTPIDSLFSNYRFAPGQVGRDTTVFNSYGGWPVAKATLSAVTDSNYYLDSVKTSFTSQTARFFDKSADSLNFNAPYWMYSGTAFFTTIDDPNVQKFAIRSVTAQKMVFESVDSTAKAFKFVVNNGQFPVVYDNDSLGQAGVADPSSVYSLYRISWTTPVADTAWGVHSVDVNVTVSRDYGHYTFLPGDTIWATPQAYFFSKQGDDLDGTITNDTAKTYKLAHLAKNGFYWYSDTTIGPALHGKFTFGSDTIYPSTGGSWTSMASAETYNAGSEIWGVKEFVFPIVANAKNGAEYGFYMGADSALHLAGDWIALLPSIVKGAGSEFDYDYAFSLVTNSIAYTFSAENPAKNCDTVAFISMQPWNSGTYYAPQSDVFYLSTSTGADLGVIENKYTDPNGITYTISSDGTIYIQAGIKTKLGDANSIFYAQHAPWEPTPFPQAVQLLLPPDGTKLTGAQPVRFVWSSLGTTANRYHLHLAAPNFALDTAIADTSLVVAVDTGAYSWTVTGENKEGEGPASAAFTFTVAPQAGVELSSPASAGDIFPNPTTGAVTLQLTAASSLLELYDMLGRVVRVFAGGHSGEITFSIADLPTGTYTLRDLTNGQYWMIVKE